MAQKGFEISIPGGPSRLILTAVFAILIVFGIIYPTSNTTVLAVCLLFPFVPCLLGLVMSKLYFVKVSSAEIAVRTRLGRRYRLRISDIKKVVCATNYRSNYAHTEIITIEAEVGKFEVEQTMRGFQEMASYLLENHARGEIDSAAISVACKKRLGQYKIDKDYRYNN